MTSLIRLGAASAITCAKDFGAPCDGLQATGPCGRLCELATDPPVIEYICNGVTPR
jgi:hypothetical protein